MSSCVAGRQMSSQSVRLLMEGALEVIFESILSKKERKAGYPEVYMWTGRVCCGVDEVHVRESRECLFITIWSFGCVRV